MSLLSLFTAFWGLHLRLRDAQAHWKEEAVMVRRRSMALSGANGSRGEAGLRMEKNGSRLSDAGSYFPSSARRGSTMKDLGDEEHYYPSGARRGSTMKDAGDEEKLDDDLAMAKRNSLKQEMTIRRAS